MEKSSKKFIDSKFVATITAGLLIGAVVTFMLSKDSEPLTPCPPPTAEAAPIDSTSAYRLIKNYTGGDRFFYLSDEQFNQMAGVRSVASTGNGFIVYFAADRTSANYDRAVISRIEIGSSRTSDLHSYYLIGEHTALNSGNLGLCPRMCDKISSRIPISGY